MEKKKFKLNIIDIIIIIAVAAVVVFLGMKVAGDAFVPGQDYTSGNNKTFHITFYSERIADYVIDNTKIGDSAYDQSSNVQLGKVVAVEKGDCLKYEISDGEYVTMKEEGFSSAYITVEVSGKASEHGVEVDNTLYTSGHTLVLYAGMGKYYLPVHSIEQVD